MRHATITLLTSEGRFLPADQINISEVDSAFLAIERQFYAKKSSMAPETKQENAYGIMQRNESSKEACPFPKEVATHE